MTGNLNTLLAFIREPESGGDYNIVWGGIRKKHRPPYLLTTMTIKEVLAWQDSIDPIYRSEAAGAYQIMEDTLRDLYPHAGFDGSEVFGIDTQDRLAIALLKRRGLDRYLAGKLSTTKFANNLAREWASLPVVSGSQKGRSAYAGDGLNKSHVAVEPFLDAVRSVLAAPAPDYVPAKPSNEVPEQGIWAALIAAILSIFGARK